MGSARGGWGPQQLARVCETQAGACLRTGKSQYCAHILPTLVAPAPLSLFYRGRKLENWQHAQPASSSLQSYRQLAATVGTALQATAINTKKRSTAGSNDQRTPRPPWLCPGCSDVRATARPSGPWGVVSVVGVVGVVSGPLIGLVAPLHTIRPAESRSRLGPNLGLTH